MDKVRDFYEDVQIREYDNGLKFVYKHFPSEMAGVSICFATGSADEAGLLGSGVAHITEHLVFEGRKDLEEKMRRYGAISNAYTSFDHTLYHFEVPKERLKDALDIFIPALYRTSFDEEVFLREKEVVLKEAKFRDDNPSSRLAKIGFKKSYLDHPYKYPIIGEIELIKRVSLEDLKKFYYQNYLPNNSVVSISGDIDYQDISQHILKLTSDLGPAPLALKNYPKESRPYRIDYSESYPGEIAYYFVSFSGVSMFSPDTEALDLLSEYLSSDKDAPLYKRFVESGICYSANSFNYAPYSEGVFGFIAVMEEENIERFKNELADFLKGIKSGSFDKARIERLKKKAALDFLRSQEEPLSISQMLARDESLALNYKYNSEYLDKFLKLNCDDLKKAAQGYIDLSKSTEVMLLPESESERKQPDKKISRKTFRINQANGLRVVLSESNISSVAAITVLLEGGLRLEDEANNGISHILSRVLVTSEIEKKFQDLGALIRPISGNNSIGFAVEALGESLPDALKLAADIIKNPSLQERELEIQKNIQAGRIKDAQINLFYQSSRLMRKNIYQNHPYRMMPDGSIDSVLSFNMAALKNFKDKVFKPDNCVVSVAGDFDSKQIASIIDKELSYWKAEPYDVSVKIDNYPDKNKHISEFIAQQQVVVEIGFMVPSIGSEERYVMDLVQMMVTGQGSLFFERIRRELGGAYALGGSLFLGRDPGIMSFYVATTPEAKDQVLNKMVAILDDIRSGNISPEELQDAKTMLRSRFYRDTITNSSLSFKMGINELLGLGYEEVNSYLDRIDALGKEDVLDFIKKYIDPQKGCFVEVGRVKN
ncbi:MAG: pitrilysin family protein [Candidatus Omnitrophica bacterium]|nr:pitrilysin family protein [Candidatus Omnitrophota bacterium]